MARKRDVRKCLVIAQRKGADAVEHAEPHGFKLHPEVFVLIPQDGKIIARRVKQRGAASCVKQQRVVCARYEGDPARFRGRAERVPQSKEIGFLYETVCDQKSAHETLTCVPAYPILCGVQGACRPRKAALCKAGSLRLGWQVAPK